MARLTAAQRQTMLDSPWFGKLPPGPRDEALDLATLRPLVEGEVVYAKDRPADAWYGILAGAIRLGASGPDGRQGLLTFLQPGAWFGDVSLFDRLPRAHDAIAHCPSTLVAVPAAQFEGLLDRYPVLYRHFVELFCQRSRLMFMALESWTACSLDERLAMHLVHLANGHGLRDGADVAINLHLPQELLAQLLGVTRQRISQILHEWERRGRVHVRYGRVVLDGAWFASNPSGPHLQSVSVASLPLAH
jgi:CRP/FNR family transcriptional regulator, cyclic AMP receptor protein